MSLEIALILLYRSETLREYQSDMFPMDSAGAPLTMVFQDWLVGGHGRPETKGNHYIQFVHVLISIIYYLDHLAAQSPFRQRAFGGAFTGYIFNGYRRIAANVPYFIIPVALGPYSIRSL